MQALLGQAGIVESPTAGAERHERERVTLNQLVEGAHVGVLAPSVLPDDVTLRQAAPDIAYGLWLPQTVMAMPHPAGAWSDRSFSEALLQSVKTSVHALLQWRTTPAAALNELATMLSIAENGGWS